MSLRFETFVEALSRDGPLCCDPFSCIAGKPCLVFAYKSIKLNLFVYSCPYFYSSRIKERVVVSLGFNACFNIQDGINAQVEIGRTDAVEIRLSLVEDF